MASTMSQEMTTPDGVSPWDVTSTHLEDTEKQEDTEEHHDEAGDEPGQPVTRIAQSHHLHHLLQTLLLLVHNALHYHRRREDPRNRHEQWEAAGDTPHEAVTTDNQVTVNTVSH